MIVHCPQWCVREETVTAMRRRRCYHVDATANHDPGSLDAQNTVRLTRDHGTEGRGRAEDRGAGGGPRSGRRSEGRGAGAGSTGAGRGGALFVGDNVPSVVGSGGWGTVPAPGAATR